MNLPRGQASIEWLIVFLCFVGLFMGLFELTRLYRAKHVLASATFAAARVGALHHGEVGPMNAELANQMSVVLVGGDRSERAMAEARMMANAIVNLPGVGIRILSPSASSLKAMQSLQWTRSERNLRYEWQYVLPNDNLRWRPRTARIHGSAHFADQDTRDANLLTINAVWCHRLVTPGLGLAIYSLLNPQVGTGAAQGACGGLWPDSNFPGPSSVSIALSSVSTIRMQSPIHIDTLGEQYISR